MSSDVQLDLFGEVLAAEDDAARRERERQEWRATFERAEWVAPWDTSGGMKKGESTLGWRCPDPDCGKVEINDYVLYINHGWSPDHPGMVPFDGRCWRVRLLASQARATAIRDGGAA